MTPRPGHSKVLSKIKPNFTRCFFCLRTCNLKANKLLLCLYSEAVMKTQNFALSNEYGGKYNRLNKIFILD